jgi:cytochrome c biogenesis protein ResB
VSVTEEVNFRFAETVPLTTLKVKSDPGIIFVWAGFVLLLAGIFMALYQPRLPGAGAKNNGKEGEV